MKKRIPTLLATMIASALYSHQGLAADLASQCMLGVPSYDRPLVKGDTNDLPVTINADNAKGNYPDDAVFTGNVDIMQGNSRLQADEVQLHQKQAEGQPEPVRTVDALGNVHYDDNQVILKGPKGWANLNTKDTNVWEGDYQMVGRQGRGKADLMKQRGENRYTILENGSFTSCLPGSDTWSVVGSEVIHDREEQVAEIWNARFKVGPVPIFYSPYLQLPVGDKRRSGFLIPNAKYTTKNYFEFYLPYYWNIAPNMDATITPHYMHRRGNIMWENEFRYLTQAGAGLMELDYLPSDKVYEDDHPKEGDKHRWLFYWQHSGVMDQVWRFNVDYTKVSDSSYFNDFDSKYGSSTDGYATQKFSVGYAVQNFDATVSTKQFQVFNDQNTSSYSAEPQLDVNYYHNDLGPFDTRIYGQAVHFVNTKDNMPEATRVHLEPTINLPLSNRWGSLNTEAKLMATHYQQTNLDSYNSDPNNKISWKIRLTASCRSLKSTVSSSSNAIWRCWRRGIPRRWNHACSTCMCRTATRAASITTILLCCNPTITACSATALMAVSTVLLPPTRSRQASQHAFMMMPPLNVLTFLLVKSTISRSLAPAMTTLNGRMTTKPVRWFGQATLTGVFQNAGGCVAECSTIPVWIASLPAAAASNTVGIRIVWYS